MIKKGEIKRKRIIIYYALAIVLPCLILGILAFRGIKNDQALAEREQRRNLLEVSHQIILETDAYLSSIEKSFAEIIDSATVPRKTIFTDSLLSRFIAQHQVVAGIFFLSGTGSLSLLNNRILFVPDDFLTLSDVPVSQSGQIIHEKGWQFEFRDKDYPKALEYYQSVLLNVTGDKSEGEILNTIARLQKKLKLEDDAIVTYNRIWNDFPKVLLQNKIPLGAVALLENSLLYLIREDTISALKTIHLLMNQLQKPVYELGHSHYANFLSKIDEIISLCKNSTNKDTRHLLERINMLKDSLSGLEGHTEYLLAFLENSKIISGDLKPGRENYNQRNKTLLYGKSYLFSFVSGNNQGQWGLIMDQEYILKNTVYHSITKYTQESDFLWEISDVNGELLLKSAYIPEDKSPVYAVFQSNLPSWSLKLYPGNAGLFISMFRPGKSLFFYIFIVIVIILAFGLFFTLQTVNNELHLSKMKSYFISTVSHEFKSPLTSIRQMAELLVRGRVPSPERQQKYLSSILTQSERLSHLIDNILDFSRMEEGYKLFHFVKADIVPVVKNVVDSFREQTDGQGFSISLVVPEPIPDVVFDPEAMSQVLNNLLDNAIKYSGESKNIGICLLRKGSKVVISVRDYGIGIRKEDRDKIFSRFFRAGDELTQTVKGSGIGLTIVKQIVEAHQGEITVDSELGKGSTFTVRIPLYGT